MTHLSQTGTWNMTHRSQTRTWNMTHHSQTGTWNMTHHSQTGTWNMTHRSQTGPDMQGILRIWLKKASPESTLTLSDLIDPGFESLTYCPKDDVLACGWISDKFPSDWLRHRRCYWAYYRCTRRINKSMEIIVVWIVLIKINIFKTLIEPVSPIFTIQH